MKGERGYIVKVRFLSYPFEGGVPSIGKRDYHYFMCEELLDRLIDEARSCNDAVLTSQIPIKIVNNKGYNYRDSTCIIIGRTFIVDGLWKSINLEKSSLYREIVKIEPVMLPYYEAFSVEAKRLSTSECIIDSDTIFSTLVIEGAMPKWKPTNNEMKINGIETATVTVTNTATNDKCGKVVTTADVLLNGMTIANSGDLYAQVDRLPELSMCDKVATNSCGWPDLASMPKNNTNYGYTYDGHTYSASIVTNITSPIDIGLDTSKLAGNNNKKKEDKNMFENMMKDFKFGPATDVKFSIYGPAFNGGDKWLARHEDEWVDVSDMLIDVGNICYMMPAAKSTIKEGDFILHKSKWARVDCIVEEENFISVEKINEQEVVQVLPTKNIFGFDYYTKLICPIDGFEGADGFGATTDNPFGMLPFMMAMKDGKKDNLLPFMLMSGKMDISNPMMLMMLSGDNSNLGFVMAMMAMEKKNK